MTSEKIALSLVVPAYNEARRLPGTLHRIREYLDAAGEAYEVIVIDDGSTDGTVECARDAAIAWPQLQVHMLTRNSGKGAAVRTGMLLARGAHRAFSDADLSTPIEELPKLRACLRGNCRVAIASRALAGTHIEISQPRSRVFMGKAYNRLLRMLVLPGIHDSQCGFKVFTAEAARVCFEPLVTQRFGFDAEALVRARNHGFEIAEVPVRWSHMDESRVSPVRDSFATFFDLVCLRLRRRRL